MRAVLNCSRGTPKAYRALGKSSVAARESPIGEYALPPPEILIGEYSAREILIGDRYWGLLGTIGDYWGMSGNQWSSEIAIGEYSARLAKCGLR